MVASTLEAAAHFFPSAPLDDNAAGGGIGAEERGILPPAAHAPPPSSRPEIFLTMTHWLTVATTSSSASDLATLRRPRGGGDAIFSSSVCRSPPRSGHGLLRNLSNSDAAAVSLGGFGRFWAALGGGLGPAGVAAVPAGTQCWRSSDFCARRPLSLRY